MTEIYKFSGDRLVDLNYWCGGVTGTENVSYRGEPYINTGYNVLNAPYNLQPFNASHPCLATIFEGKNTTYVSASNTGEWVNDSTPPIDTSLWPPVPPVQFYGGTGSEPGTFANASAISGSLSGKSLGCLIEMAEDDPNTREEFDGDHNGQYSNRVMFAPNTVAPGYLFFLEPGVQYTFSYRIRFPSARTDITGNANIFPIIWQIHNILRNVGNYNQGPDWTLRKGNQGRELQIHDDKLNVNHNMINLVTDTWINIIIVYVAGYTPATSVFKLYYSTGTSDASSNKIFDLAIDAPTAVTLPEDGWDASAGKGQYISLGYYSSTIGQREKYDDNNPTTQEMIIDHIRMGQGTDEVLSSVDVQPWLFTGDSTPPVVGGTPADNTSTASLCKAIWTAGSDNVTTTGNLVYQPYNHGFNLAVDPDFSGGLVSDPTTGWVKTAEYAGWSLATGLATHVPVTQGVKATDNLYTACCTPDASVLGVVRFTFTCTAGSLSVGIGTAYERVLTVLDTGSTVEIALTGNAASSNLTLAASVDFAGTVATVSYEELTALTETAAGVVTTEFTAVGNTTYRVSYKVKDEAGLYSDLSPSGAITTPAAVGAEVNAVADSFIVEYETATVLDVLRNDTASNETPPLVVSSVDTTGTSGGVFNNGSNVTYTPADGFSGIDTFDYIAEDSGVPTQSSAATVTVTVRADAGILDVTVPYPQLTAIEQQTSSYGVTATQSNNYDVTWSVNSNPALDFVEVLSPVGDPDDKIASLVVVPSLGESITTPVSAVTVTADDGINQASVTINVSLKGAANKAYTIEELALIYPTAGDAIDDNTIIFGKSSTGEPQPFTLAKLKAYIDTVLGPTITVQPTGYTIGEFLPTTALTVTSPDATSYQWYRNDASIPSATSASYTPAPFELSQSGDEFYCAVTNGDGTINTNTVAITVTQSVYPLAGYAGWSNTFNGGVTIESTNNSSPGDLDDAVHISKLDGSGDGIEYDYTTADNETLSITGYVKNVDSVHTKVRFLDNDDGPAPYDLLLTWTGAVPAVDVGSTVTNGTATSIGDNWYRVEFDVTMAVGSTDSTLRIYPEDQIGANGNGIYSWGWSK